ncbi:uncharacterized protein LOC127708715 [Mytilus californianus]|uniref:uncharacterized protein LOC127708715 n=1 Tax=Mytilus californianus TaxID=6549 RepID=UPI0022475B2D|nr:uncharacterized protein LOC127708715 [Mytilus californianus]XP_052069795.1 uncharacterized protein LOC127708715 [Mytilus californianus]
MGACYSKSGHEASLSPKQKSPHKKQNNGLAIKIEYTPVKPHEDDRLSANVDNNFNHDNKSTDGQLTITEEENEKDIDLNEIEKNIPLIDKDIDDLKHGLGVATSDSGIESLSPNEIEAHVEATSSQPLNTSHSRKKKVDHILEDKECSNCTCGAQNRSFTYDAQKIKCETAPTTPDKDEKKVIRRQDSRHSTVSCENVLLDMSKRSSREIRHFDSEASLDLPSAFQSLQDVKTMQMDGKEVVVIDAELYSQVLEELATLKYKLSQLTDLIQLQSISGDDQSEINDSTPLNSPRVRTSLNFSKS